MTKVKKAETIEEKMTRQFINRRDSQLRRYAGDLPPCFWCAEEMQVNYQISSTYPRVGVRTRYFIQCPGCGLCGPEAKTAKRAATQWRAIVEKAGR